MRRRPHVTRAEAVNNNTVAVMIQASAKDVKRRVGIAITIGSATVLNVMLRVGIPFSVVARLFTRSECQTERMVIAAATRSVSAAMPIIMLAMILSMSLLIC